MDDFCSFLVRSLFPFFVNVEDLEEAALDQKRPVQLEVRAQFEVWAGKIVLLQPGGFGRWLFKKASSNPSTEAANSYFGSVVSSFKCFPTFIKWQTFSRGLKPSTSHFGQQGFLEAALLPLANAFRAANAANADVLLAEHLLQQARCFEQDLARIPLCSMIQTIWELWVEM